jgi:predicted PurR-regulated permease PerM
LARHAETETRSKVGGWPLAAGITVVLVFLFFIRYILLPFILAAAVAFLLTPAIDRIHQRLRLPRWMVAVAAYVCVVAILGLLLYFVGGLVIRDVSQIIRQFPQTLHRLVSELVELGETSMGSSVNADAVTNEILAQVRALFATGTALSFASYGVEAVFGTILGLVLLIYFLISGKEIAAGVFWLVPPEYRREVDAVAAKILPLLWRYFVGLLIVVTYTSVAAWIGFGLVFHLPRAPLLALVVGVLELIPVIGPALSIGLVGLTAIQQTSIWAVIGLACLAVGLRLSIDQLVGPLVLGSVARVHPVVIIFSFLSGAVLFGVIGLLLAVPVAASIKIILTIYYSEPIRGQRPPKPAEHAASRRG